MKSFKIIKEKFGLPAIACLVLGGLGAGIIALKYLGTLQSGFTNVEEILHIVKTTSAPGIWLLTLDCQLQSSVRGFWACRWCICPSLMIGAAVGAVFEGFSCRTYQYNHSWKCCCCPATGICTGMGFL